MSFFKNPTPTLIPVSLDFLRISESPLPAALPGGACLPCVWPTRVPHCLIGGLWFIHPVSFRQCFFFGKETFLHPTLPITRVPDCIPTVFLLCFFPLLLLSFRFMRNHDDWKDGKVYLGLPPNWLFLKTS